MASTLEDDPRNIHLSPPFCENSSSAQLCSLYLPALVPRSIKHRLTFITRSLNTTNLNAANIMLATTSNSINLKLNELNKKFFNTLMTLISLSLLKLTSNKLTLTLTTPLPALFSNPKTKTSLNFPPLTSSN